jgi:hypothetical protein
MYRSVRVVFLAATLVLMAVTSAASQMPEQPAPDQPAAGLVMLILRGIASSERPRGQLDEEAALEYARQNEFQGEVLDVAGNTGAGSSQVRMAIERIRRDKAIRAIYGVSGGGYNARRIWAELTAAERERISRIIVVGSPGVTETDFPGVSDVFIKRDPPAGHMAGPKVLLESIEFE